MKKILLGIVVITLLLITFFQYKKYRRFNPPSNYEYAISADIDVNYHDQAMVNEYYQNAVEIGAFARMKWTSESIDVRFPDDDSMEEVNASKYYNRLLSRTQFIEEKLKRSAELKGTGLSNDQVRLVESGVPVSLLDLMENKDAITVLSIGDQSRFVWELQKRLIARGYEHQLDGVFGIATQNALLTFQNDQGIYPSGAMNDEVFALLFVE